MKSLTNWQAVNVTEEKNNLIVLQCGQHYLHLYVLEDHMIRVLVKRQNQLRLEKTWTIAPKVSDSVSQPPFISHPPFEGRDRLSTQGFSLPDYTLTTLEDGLQITTNTLRVTIHQPLWLEWEYKNQAGHWAPLYQDRKTGAYALGVHDNKHAHFIHRSDNEHYYGLGEKTGDLNRNQRRFEMRNLDAMGYNAKTTDPLYKHIPFYITHLLPEPERASSESAPVSVGIFYDNLSNCWFDLGNELDNYHLPYRSYRSEDGDLDYYVMFGESILDVSKQFVRLTGGTAFGPKWSLGYSGSTMQYTDADNAQERLESFVDQCQQHNIPCDSFQLSSGYTSIGDKRYVFNWNYDKVPTPQAMADKFHQSGMKLAANIKPCLLHDHPMFEQVKAEGLFVQDSLEEQPENSVFWDANGSHLDFTNPNTVTWWKKNVTEQLLEKGIDSTWNDNNEYEIWDHHARCHGFGKTIPIGLIRPLQPLLMMRTSYEAQLEFAPHLRPFLISRSGCPGMNRYVQTWTGDNRTNWESLRYNIRMGLGMSLSGIYNVGHDVGGFAGLQPEPELFVRWVQNGVMHPRFTIHSWNDDGSVNEPWMYPEVLPMIQAAIALRYRLLPYFYQLLWFAHHHDEPMIRPTFLDHEQDRNTFEECDDFLLGEDLLVASVVEQGQTEREVYLPNNQVGWYDFYSEQWFAGGQTIILPAPLDKLPLLAKAGSIIPVSERIDYADAKQDVSRCLSVYPFKESGVRELTLFDDDGESFAYQNGEYIKLNITLNCNEKTICLDIRCEGKFTPAYQSLRVNVPADETRILIVNGQEISHGSEWMLPNNS